MDAVSNENNNPPISYLGIGFMFIDVAIPEEGIDFQSSSLFNFFPLYIMKNTGTGNSISISRLTLITLSTWSNLVRSGRASKIHSSLYRVEEWRQVTAWKNCC